MKEKGIYQALLKGNCPRCRQGSLFTHSILNLSKLNSTKPSCDYCGLVYEREPGFFYGAMYISYAFSVGIMLSVSLLTYLIFDNPPAYYYITAVTTVSILLYPVNFRYSRILFLYLFGGVTYTPDYKKE
jgi:uncharacterized protein (DUF983 family)